MKCINCGREIEEKADVCPYCGTRQHPAEDGDSGSGENAAGEDREASAGAGEDREASDDAEASAGAGESAAAEEAPGSEATTAAEEAAGAESGDEKADSASVPAETYDYENADESTPYKYDMSDEEVGRGPALRFLIILIAMIILSVFFVGYAIHLTKVQNKVPELDDITYSEFLKEYDLTSGDTDSLEEAYLDKVVLKFGEAEHAVSASPFGADKKYSFKVEIYAPDLDAVYSSNTDTESAEKAIENLSESDLAKQGDTLKVTTNNKGTIKDDDAERLQRAVENSYEEPPASYSD
ncbi:MAG: zinc ribbon domain-containing protein [Anaerovoracaceae bacterium]|jgi:rRNA maturation endonuclease Nob1